MPRCGQHDVLGLQILVDDRPRVAVRDGRECVLHHLGDPALVGDGVHWLEALHVLLQVAATARLHDDVEVLLVLEVLEDPEDVRVVQLLQHGELFANLFFGRLRLTRLRLGDDLADPNPPVVVGVVLRPVCDGVARAERALAELLLHLVDLAESRRVLLEKLDTPTLVALRGVSSGWPLGALHTDLLASAEEAQEPEEQGLESFLVHAAVPPGVLRK
mmetsp:Transcript_75261/g.218562  ORF Transcript_75261/g.218562 Transcript_75261/m.218562 type:complete len:217 (+) Transcript_75261:346-996(+)